MNLLNRLQLSDSSYSGLEWHEVLRTSYAERQGPVKQAAILNRLQLADGVLSVSGMQVNVIDIENNFYREQLL